MNENDVQEIVEEIDDVNPERINREAERLGIAPAELLRRVMNEVEKRL